MRRVVVPASLALIIVLFVVVPVWQSLPPLNYVPLQRSSDAGSRETLPANSVVLNVAECAELTAPFVVRADASAACGKVAVLPEGGGSEELAGRIALTVDCPSAAARHAWARVRWNDSCGNSLSLSFDGKPALKVGQDAIYRVWHWVRVGELPVTKGPHELVLAEREDGVAVDQILLSADAGFAPSGSYGREVRQSDIRRFADDFARSPGHGLGGWRVVFGDWNINFDLDPNRIPNQYSLGIDHTGIDETAIVLVDGPPWRGVRFGVSFTVQRPCAFGVLLHDSAEADSRRDVRATVEVVDDDAVLRVTIPGVAETETISIGEHVHAGQWHRMVVERWAWLLRVRVDDRVVYSSAELPARPEVPGLFVRSGTAAFDDVAVVAIPWIAEDGADFRMTWELADDSEWYRRRSNGRKTPLLGRHGCIELPPGAQPFFGLYIEEEGTGRCFVEAPATHEETLSGGGRLFSELRSQADPCDGAIRIGCEKGVVRVRRVAVGYGGSARTAYCEGPYHFTRSKIEDPADYLDFTDDELKEIRESPDVEKLRRGHRWRPLVGPAIAEGIWRPAGGKWRAASGCLRGDAPGAVRFWRDYLCDVDLRMKVKMATDDAQAEIVLYEGQGSSLGVSLGGTPAADDAGLHLPAPKVGEWHELRVRYEEGRISSRLGDAQWTTAAADRGPGGGVLLVVPSGSVAFDDIEIVAPHRTASGRFYAFDRMETDWRREGGDWVDHGGINCVLASSWVSLVAPEGRGTLWNKTHFGSDLLVHVTLNANSVWYGWNKDPTHEHYPYDNVCTLLSSAQDWDKGYRLELNSRNRTATVLYRNGKEVAAVAQDENFPVRYVGGHFPFRPRVATVALWKDGAKLVGIVNGQKVLEYTDPAPLDVNRVGLGGYNTRVNLALIQIRGDVQ